MEYWLTSHWPPLKGEHARAGVWIQHKKQAAGKDLRPRDQLLIYETGSGPPELRRYADGSIKRLRRERGRARVIMIAEVDEKLHVDRSSRPKGYVGREEPIWWRWFASATKLSESGFVPRREVNRVLKNKSGRKYNPNYNFHGFGDLNSGLKHIDEMEFQTLVQKFRSRSRPPAKVPPRRRRGKGQGESKEHKLLKNFVFAVPTAALGEKGLTSIDEEYEFPTGDSADVVLEDRFGRIVGVEVEIRVGDNQTEGVLQAIKYRSMLELQMGRKRGEGRAFLVAYHISKKMRKRCAEYGVECFEVGAKRVEAWRKSGSRGDGWMHVRLA